MGLVVHHQTVVRTHFLGRALKVVQTHLLVLPAVQRDLALLLSWTLDRTHRQLVVQRDLAFDQELKQNQILPPRAQHFQTVQMDSASARGWMLGQSHHHLRDLKVDQTLHHHPSQKVDQIHPIGLVGSLRQVRRLMRTLS